MEIVYEFPTLYSKASNGKIKRWDISVGQDGDNGVIRTSHGYATGKQSVNDKYIYTGKNIGKINETTPYLQAYSEASSKWTKKQNKGYVEDPNGESDIKLPMKAHVYHDHKNKINIPCYLQPKLNGVRCIAYRPYEDTIMLTSTEGKEFTTLEHIANELKRVLPIGARFDGEIYKHGMTLQAIVSILKCEKEDRGREQLEYHVYDYCDDTLGFQARWQGMGDFETEHIKEVETTIVCSREDIPNHHEVYTAQGYEGVMLRNIDGKYRYNYRSYDLQKYKSFLDDEYMITAVVEGQGIEEGCAIYECKTKDGNKFRVRPTGTHEDRKQIFIDRDAYVGQLLTVKYFELTPDGIPFHPVGLAVRNYE